MYLYGMARLIKSSLSHLVNLWSHRTLALTPVGPKHMYPSPHCFATLLPLYSLSQDLAYTDKIQE